MLNLVWGSNKDKPLSARSLAEALSERADLHGYLYIGYPVMGSPVGPVKFDALLLSPELGLVAFDLVEGTDIGDFRGRQDEIASMLEVKLKPHAALKERRKLRFEIQTITYAPAKAQFIDTEAPYRIANQASLLDALTGLQGITDPNLYSNVVAAIQVVTSIRSGKARREVKREDSRGARLKRIEESIANLDHRQSRAVIETVEGVQRIRGLAGSGKTIILALKVAYLHAQNPDWKIAVTFNTRSLKEQFKRLINGFTIEQTSAEPDWDNIEIVNAWGGLGSREQDGIYHSFCRENLVPFLDFGAAKSRFGSAEKAFAGACAAALSAVREPKPSYDLILVDEAQDFPPEFLRLCYASIREPKRLVYAYDELQSLTSNPVLPPEELFGRGASGSPIVSFDSSESAVPRQDIILEKCYRNSRPVLATAHALGFGIHHKKGLVQIFDQDSLWTDVGYSVVSGVIEPGKQVVLARTEETSPLFLEVHSPPEDLVQFHVFPDHASQSQWLADCIERNIREDELRPEDIVVINPDPLTTQDAVGLTRRYLYEKGIETEVAGVSTSRDIFVVEGAVTFTGIFRAKGNEAGMVYVLNAQDCYSGFTKQQTALVRNRLFTAITRSKAWVRVLGVGRGMELLSEEWKALQADQYQLAFTYPTEEEKRKLRLINVDPTPRATSRERALKRQKDSLIQAAKAGQIDIEALIAELKAAKGSE